MKETKLKQTEIGMIPDDWEVKKLENLATKIGDGIHTTPKYNESGSFYFINGNNLKNGKINLSFDTKKVAFSEAKKYEVSLSQNTLLMSINGTIGNLAYYNNEPIILGKSSAYINVANQHLKKYLYYFLQSINIRNYFDNNLTGTTIKNLGLGIIRKTIIALPPTLAEQQKIAKALSDVDNVISTLEKLITKKKNLKQGTMQQLLTGKKRLPGFAKSDKFKQTEIGEIPEDWEVKSFEELFDICTSTISLNFVKTAFYVGTENMLPNRGGVLNYENELNYLSVREYRKEDILFSNIRPYLKKLWLANHNGGCSTDVLVFRKKNKDDSALFLYMLISDDRFFQIVNDNAIGTKMPRGDKNIIKQIKFCLPSKLEQTVIANVLSSMDKEIEALEAKLGKYRDLKTGMMQQLLTGKIRLV